MNIYLLVHTGGSYSDWFHRNLHAYSDKNEAEKWVENNEITWTKIQNCLNQGNYRYLTNLEKSQIENKYPPNTPNRRINIKREIDQLQELYNQGRIDRILTALQCSDLNEEIIQKVIKNNFSSFLLKDIYNPSEIKIEKIEVKEGSKLY